MRRNGRAVSGHATAVRRGRAVTRMALGVVLVLVACRAKPMPPREAEVPSIPGDTQAQPVPVPAAPTVGPEVPPGAPVGPVAPPARTPTGGAKTPPSPYIGYDSAFGPTFELDSTGKAVPIKTKKPGGA